MSDIYIALTAADYQCLVAGKKLTVRDRKTSNEIHIILKDIGFNLMHFCIEQAEKNNNFFDDLERDN